MSGPWNQAHPHRIRSSLIPVRSPRYVPQRAIGRAADYLFHRGAFPYLALSTFGLVQLPSRFVEAAIAASILYVGAENLLRREQQIRGRAVLTFAFGLVHGLGFASVLREMGIANSGVAAVVPLVAFNAGVEAGQLSVAALVLPLVWLSRKQDRFVRYGVPACSLAVALAGGFWLIDRTLH